MTNEDAANAVSIRHSGSPRPPKLPKKTENAPSIIGRHTLAHQPPLMTSRASIRVASLEFRGASFVRRTVAAIIVCERSTQLENERSQKRHLTSSPINIHLTLVVMTFYSTCMSATSHVFRQSKSRNTNHLLISSYPRPLVT